MTINPGLYTDERDLKPMSTWDIAVIGGGPVGVSIAWGLERSGLRPVVLDGEDLDLRASPANSAKNELPHAARL